MRGLTRAGRGRIVAAGASVLVAVSALTAALAVGAVPARAQTALTPVNKITLSPAGPLSTPLGSPFVFLPITATETDPAATLTLSATGLPPGLSYAQVTSSGDPALTVAGIITATGAYKVTVTAQDNLPAMDMATETFTWTAQNNITLKAPAAELTRAGTAAAPVTVTTFDDDPLASVSLAAAGLPKGLTFNPGTGTIAGTPTGPAGVHDITVKATDSTRATGSAVIRWDVYQATPNPQGQIRLALDGKCLQDPGGKTGNGTHVEIGTCASGPAQLWTVTAGDKVTVSGRCLDVGGAGNAAGKPLELEGCGDSPRESWRQGTGGELVNTWSGLCVTDPGASEKNGVTATMAACRARSDEQWTLPAQPVLAPVAGSCADDQGGGDANGTSVDLSLCDAAQGQAWSFRPDGTIRAGRFSGKCVTVRGPLGQAGTKVVLWTCAPGDKGQQWTVSPVNDTSSELSVHGVCLAITSMTAANASQLVTSACGPAGPRVRWHIG